MDFRDQVVWITGASSGIGESLAYAFNQLGANLILSARNEDKLNLVQSRMTDNGKTAIMPLDVSQYEDIHLATGNALKIYGHIDILVNNAGISQRASVEESDLSIDKKIFDVNFFGNIALTRAILPHFLERKVGRIVVISSVAGKLGPPFRSGYAASKHALHGWYDALRAETSHKGVHVHMICPGYIRTKISVNALNPTGGKHGKMDPGQAKGMSAEDCAEKIIQAIKNDRKEVIIGKEWMFVLLRKLAPGLYYHFLNKRARAQTF